jgi:hypothetical protein
MAYFAELDNNNIVLRVLSVDNVNVEDLPFPESEPVGVAYLQNIFGPDGVWKQTSYNKNFRYNYASIGFTFDPNVQPYGAFIPPMPEGDKWYLDTATYNWISMPPVVGQPPEVF